MACKQCFKRNGIFSLALLVGLIIAVGCGSGGGGSDDGDNSGSDVTYDASGDWTFSMTPDADSLESNTNCDEDLETSWEEDITINQNGRSFTATDENGNTFQGTVSGKDYSYSGSFTDDETGDAITVNGVFTMTNSSTLSGEHTVRTEYGNLYCQYDVGYTAAKSGGASLDSDDDQDGYTENQGDCNDQNADIYPGADEICGDNIDQDCDGQDEACGQSLDCCECKWTCFFVNQYGSGTATSTATVRTTGSFTNCQDECWDEATNPSSDCVSNIDMIYARPCN